MAPPPGRGSDEFIKSSVEDLVPILSESKDTSRSDSECILDLPSCNDFSPIDVPEGKFVIFSNPLFDSNDDFTSSDEESLSDEDVPEDNVKIYSNPLLNSMTNNLSVWNLFYCDEDECFDPGGDIDEIDAFLDIDVSTDIENGYHDSEGDIIYLKNFLIDDTIPNLPPREFLDYDLRSLKDEPYNDDLMNRGQRFEDSCARGFVHRSLGLQSFACLYMGIRYPGYY
ncbi:hypothetical protein Tco_0276625 [Tanacetum coccineum]